MKKIVSLFFLSQLVGTFAYAQGFEVCHQLSSGPEFFSRTPEVLCIRAEDAASSARAITLKSGMRGEVQIAQFNLEAETVYSNDYGFHESYGVKNPSNSVFNQLRVQLVGSYDEGTYHVNIGNNRFYGKFHSRSDF